MTGITRIWLRGLISAFISGGAGAFAGGSAAAMIDPNKFNLGGGLEDLTKMVVAMFVVTGLVHVFGFLQQSPLPPPVSQVAGLSSEPMAHQN